MKIFLLSCAIGISSPVNSQIFPGLEGDELIEAIQNSYTPYILLNDSDVKDTLYARVFKLNDTIRCIYSHLPRFLPEGVDPSQYLFGTGNEIESFNLEHGWPQAKGAGDGTQGNLNMHHLYPSRVKINSDRANFPFEEISDNATQKWYYLYQEMNTKPLNNIDEYSEFVNGKFEPREAAAGDIARAMFYFWTIYRNDAIAADPEYFEIQREYLCHWHLQDPVDEFENLRNERIAFYQDDKVNPFITDCTLAKRTYCPTIAECQMVSVNEKKVINRIIQDASKNRFQILSEDPAQWNLSIVNLLGQPVFFEDISSNGWSRQVDIHPGLYVVSAFNKSAALSRLVFIR